MAAVTAVAAQASTMIAAATTAVAATTAAVAEKMRGKSRATYNYAHAKSAPHSLGERGALLLCIFCGLSADQTLGRLAFLFISFLIFSNSE